MSIKAAMIDSREPKEFQRMKLGGVPTVVTALDCGDLWAQCADDQMLVIERKTPSDLLGSIDDRRLFQQAAAMRQKSPWAYVVVTGLIAHNAAGQVVIDGHVTGWNFDAVQGALADVQEMGVTVIYCQSDSHYEETVLRLARRNRDTSKTLAPRVQPHVMNAGERLLTSLPGIGLERAKLLLSEYDDRPAHALAWLTWMHTFVDIAGIADGTKTNVRRALNLDEGEEMYILDAAQVKEVAAARQASTPEMETVTA